MTKFEAGLVDCDGTILDTEGQNRRIIKLGLDLHKVPRTEQEIFEAMRYPWDETVARLVPPSKAADFRKSCLDFSTRFVGEINFFPEAQKILHFFRLQGLPLIIISSRDEESFEIIWYGKQLNRYFEGAVYQETVKNHKPHAEPSLRGCEILGVDPNGTFGIGDSGTDILSFRDAGVKRTFAFTKGYSSREELTLAKPDYFINSFAEIPILLSPV